jgi:single-stranded-DNA-specific exonuclease
LRLDAEVQLSEVNGALLEQHDALQPFGMGNPQPVFFAREVSAATQPRLLKEKHLSLMLQQARAQRRAIWFGGAAEELPKPPWDVAFQLERNEWQGRITVDLHVRAIRGSSR